MRWSAATVLLALAAGCASPGSAPSSRGPDPRTLVLDPDQVDEPPELVRCGDWLDHGQARLRWAVVQFVVTATGEVRNPRVIEAPARIPEVGTEALRIVRTCTFRPAMAGGKPVAVRWSKRFDFPEAA